MVGIGASAGGVEALTDFFAHVPQTSSMAYLVVLHLLSGHISRLPEIIARVTGMPVGHAADGVRIEPGHVYVIPPDALLSVADGRLKVQTPRQSQHESTAVDFLFSSLAAEFGPRAIGVVLSGAGSDGALGLKAIKQAGGVAVAQGSNGSRPRHAEMPSAAIAATAVDLILPVEQMGERIANLPFLAAEPAAPDDADDEAAVPPVAREQIADLKPVICSLLRAQVGHDFSGYKRPTFMRRVHRRMQFLDLDAAGYVQRLGADQDEVTLLFHDLLIGVTAFFRDTETFETIRKDIVPQLFAGKGADSSVRVWVPGCATGEEAYSLAILLREHMATLSAVPRVQIFATDLDEAAIALARAGRYPSALVKGVTDERLARFFTATNGSYVVTKDIRELCTFSVHSVIRDPPFSHIDLISCRNVLIYLDAEVQAQVARTFHYALVPGGFLVLGGSETVTRHTELFETLDRTHRIFQRLGGSTSTMPIAEMAPERPTPRAPAGRGRDAEPPRFDIAQLANLRVLERFAPAFVVVNAEGAVRHFSSRTGKYLEAAQGAPSRDLVSMARRGLRPELRPVLRRALETGKSIIRESVQVDIEGGVQEIVLTVEPLDLSGPEVLYLVVFADVTGLHPRDDATPPMSIDATIELLERELREMREQVQSTAEQHDTALEELKSSNEELHSVNEELQSTNEELETSREEIQSMNEELQTVNAQLVSKVEELDRLNSDLRNLFESTKVATIFLDRFMVIRSFTPAVGGIYNLIPGDIGRPLTDITSQLGYVTLEDDFHRTMQVLQPLERRVTKRDGSIQYLMRMAPYRTADNKVDGALITFVDVTSVVKAGATDSLTGVELRELMAQVLAPHVKQRPDSVSIDGPAIMLSQRGVIAIGIIAHDLMRQSAEGGALSVASGQVRVDWRIDQAAGEPAFRLHWTETGVPAQAAPLDASLVRFCVEHELQGQAIIATEADKRGVTLTMKPQAVGASPVT